MSALKTDPHNIPWFNPREMDDATVTALSTGRERLTTEFLETVERRLRGIPSGLAGEHWLVTGTRGAGKSYFLRYAQIRTRQRFAPENVRFVLLPEELPNVAAPHDLLDEIRRMLIVEQGDVGRSAQWRSEAPAQLWQQALQRLLAVSPAQLLVIGIENFAEVVQQAFADDVAASLLRKLMEHEPRVLILASAVDGSFDEDYGKRLFLQFAKHPLPIWDGQAHRTYLTQRAALLQRQPSLRQLARIDAYSRYTGGNARIAAILAAAILEEQGITQASADLNATLDKMSDYYRSLMKVMPAKTRTLFDALIRGGEPCSQTTLAERVGARQNDISRAFRWLLDGGYLLAQRPKGQKETLYQVADRLFVQWYRMRYLNPGQLSRLAVLAELLADTLEFGEKWRYALHFAATGEPHDALLLAQLGYRDCGIEMDKLQAEGVQINTLLQWGKRLMELPAQGSGKDTLTRQIELLEDFPSDAAMREEFETARMLAKCCHPYPELPSGEELAMLCMGSLSLNAVEKLMVIRQLPRFSREQWTEIEEVFREETIQFEELIPTEGDIIKGLRKINELGQKHPWTMTWVNDFPRKSEQYLQEELDFLRIISSGIVCLSATESPAALEDYLSKAWRSLWDAERKLLAYPEGLDFLNQLLSASHEVFSTEQRGRLLVLAARLNAVAGQDDLGVVRANEAKACLKTVPPTPENAYWLAETWERIGWGQGQGFDWATAFTSHQAALTLLLKHEDHRYLAWNTGQLARYRWHLEGLTAAWSLIEGQPIDSERARIVAIQQLGDGVVDVQRQSDPQAAYAKARELFVFLGQQNLAFLPGALRALFIDMVDQGLALPTLRDLAQDLVGLYPNSSHAKEIAALAGTLEGWIIDLQKVQDRTSKLPDADTDPDWLLTLDALNKALPLNTRIRLGLTEPPQLGKDAAALFKRMMGFVRTPQNVQP